MDKSQAQRLTRYLRLHAIPKAGFKTLSKFSNVFDCHLSQLCEVESQRLLAHGWQLKQIQTLKGSCQATEERIRHAFEWLKFTDNGYILHIDDAAFPPALLQTESPPLVLFCQGNLEYLTFPKLGVVGTRSPTQYAYDALEKLLPPLGATDIVTVSGLALGVDAICHRTSLANQIPTIAVLGNGIDVVYPARHRNLYGQIKDKGLIISEFWPGTKPQAFNFPRRNRLVSGLSAALLITEGRTKSGTMVSVKFALEQNKEILAVPCSINNINGELSHHLISQGAIPITQTLDMLEQVPAFNGFGVLTSENEKNYNQDLASDPLLASVGDSATSVELIAKRTGTSVVDVLTQLLEYELRGLVASTAEGYVKLRG